jgi:hypothetical protein
MGDQMPMGVLAPLHHAAVGSKKSARLWWLPDIEKWQRKHAKLARAT